MYKSYYLHWLSNVSLSHVESKHVFSLLGAIAKVHNVLKYEHRSLTTHPHRPQLPHPLIRKEGA